jgi:hypothetical protein
MAKTTLTNLLLGGAIVTPKSGALIENIHTVEHKWFGTVIGGYVATYPNGIFSPMVVRDRWTTIELTEEY